MDSLLAIDTCFRLLAAGQLLLIALVTARGAAPLRIRAASVALLLCVMAYLANVSPALHLPDSPLWPVVQLASQGTVVALWVFALLIFERPIDWRVATASGLVTIGCWAAILYARYVTHVFPVRADEVQHLLALVLSVHAIVVAVMRRGDDLLELRRAFRTGFVVVVGIQTLAVITAETFLGHHRDFNPLMLVQSGTSFVSVLAFGAVLLSSNAALLFDAEAPVPADRGPLSPSEHVLKRKLDAAMAAGDYRASALTIGRLAEQLGTPEHRLRALINQRLGFRNFSDFLNSHRIADARAWLADPAKVDLPVLTIAMDLGYGSLAPFNRAFRDATGQTPSDFRRAAILDPARS